MKKRKSLVELGKILRVEKQYNQELVDSLKDDQNPQVKEIAKESEGRLEMIENILLYIETGNTYQFTKKEKLQ